MEWNGMEYYAKPVRTFGQPLCDHSTVLADWLAGWLAIHSGRYALGGGKLNLNLRRIRSSKIQQILEPLNLFALFIPSHRRRGENTTVNNANGLRYRTCQFFGRVMMNKHAVCLNVVLSSIR